MSFQLPHGSRRSADLVYQTKHHGDTVFRNSFFEELHMFNDDCDGLVWKKEHSKDCVISITSYYPGSYMSYSYPTTLIHPKDPDFPGVVNGGMINAPNYTGASLTRTKDFVICQFPTYYSSYTGLRCSNDGIHWTPFAAGYPASLGQWSTKENVGLCAGIFADDPDRVNGLWRLEIDETGKISRERLGVIGEDGIVSPTGYLGDLAFQGLAEDGNHRWYKFINVDGDKYTSPLPGRYTYTDMRESDPAKRVKWADYSWNFRYLNCKYYAYTMKTSTIYWNEVKQEWQTIRVFMVIESSDGFKHITEHIVMNPCPYINYQDYNLWYFNNRLIILEIGKERETDTEQYLKIRDLNNNVIGTVIEKVDMPFAGRYIDAAYDSLTFRFRGSEAESNRNCVRGFGWGFTNALYIKDGKPSEPYGSLIWGTAFCKNGWSPNSYDDGGFIFLRVGDKDPFVTKQPEYAMAYRCANQMIDRDNATWGEDYYKITIKGGSGTMRLAEERTHYTNSYTVEKSSEDWVKHCYFHIDQIVRLTYDNKIVRRRLRRGGQTFFELREPEYNVASGYYMEGTGVYSTVFGREFSKVNPGPAYVFIIGYLSRSYQYISPMVISTDEFNVVYDPGGPVTNSKIIDYGGFKWYYNGFSYGFGGDDPTVPYYLNLHSLGGSATEQEMVLECLKTVHPIN